MSHDYEAEIKKHQEFATEQHLRVNKLLAQRDPLYEQRYQDKRNLLLAEIHSAHEEVEHAEEILNHKERKHSGFVKELEALDQARKNWESM